jgi:hypothetical protein
MTIQCVNCGTGAFVLLDEVVCESCGPRLFNTFDDDPLQLRIVFPAIVRVQYVRDIGPCVCGGQVRAATRPLGDPETINHLGYIELGPFPDGETVCVYDVADEELERLITSIPQK